MANMDYSKLTYNNYVDKIISKKYSNLFNHNSLDNIFNTWNLFLYPMEKRTYSREINLSYINSR